MTTEDEEDMPPGLDDGGDSDDEYGGPKRGFGAACIIIDEADWAPNTHVFLNIILPPLRWLVKYEPT